MGSQDEVASRIEIETKAKLKAMNESVNQVKEGVIQDLLQKVVHGAKPQLHRNLKI